MQNPIVHPDFLLDSDLARRLYHDVAAAQPIIDFHCHLSPEKIATDHRFRSLTGAWLDGDHYKWRAMRIHGVGEQYCSGEAGDWEKFDRWAETVPFTIGNPLYHWTHLELNRPFGIQELLAPATARDIYERAQAFLDSDTGTVRGILRGMQVEVVATTDDPCDDLRYHEQLAAEGGDLAMWPSFRPDATLKTENLSALNAYLDRLSKVSGSAIEHFIDLINALQQRVDYFHDRGCRASDHGLETAYAADFTNAEINRIFHKIRLQTSLSFEETEQYRSAVVYHLGQMYHEKGWVMQLHLGAMRDNNTRMLQQLGPDTGFDSMGDFSQARALSRFLDRLDTENKLPKTILYNLNPADNEVFATMVGNFSDGSIPGKIQWGPAWWFLDQLDGMEAHLQVLSNMGLLSHFVGMLTDSRSFLSFPRHEYFRRILCARLGRQVAQGLLPADEAWLGEVVRRICHTNAREFFQRVSMQA